MNLTQEANVIVKRLQLEMPIEITLPDPISGANFTLSRENILSLLVIDTPNLALDSQSVAAHYATMARAQRACERAAASGEASYRAWKARTAEEFRKANKDRKITVAEVEEYYRGHEDYEKVSSLPNYYEKLAGLFDDLKRAFEIKSRLISSQVHMLGGELAAHRAESRGGEMPPMPTTPPLPRRTPRS
jgi:hypothetical protein